MAPNKTGAIDQMETDQARSNIKPGLIFTGTGLAFKGEVTVKYIVDNDLHVDCKKDGGNSWDETWNLEHTIAGFKSGEYKVITPAPLLPTFNVILNEQTPRVLGKVDPEKDKALIISFVMFARGLENCVGLSANQVSYKGKRIKKRFFVLTDGKDWYPVLNPRITKKYGKPIQQVEGCKTWPGKAISAQRYLKLDMEFQDIKGSLLKQGFEGFGAQIIQHEVDHLNGIEEKFTDKVLTQSIGRNEPCPCGSGRKYKKCCIKLEN